MDELWLVRHGQTEWSRDHRHTGRTDLPLLPEGEDDARALRDRLDRPFALVLSSPLQRARRTAELAGLSPEVEPDLQEWDYGPAEGLTTAQMGPGWSVWDGVPLGETIEQVATRTRRVLTRAAAVEGDVLLVAHGHVLRILTATYLGMDPRAARHFVLHPATVSVLGTEHDYPAMTRWNA